MTNSIMQKRENIFLFSCLTLINILCLTKFIYSFFNLLSKMEQLRLLSNIVDENFPSFISYNIICTLCLILTISLFLMTFILLFLRSDFVKRNIIILCFTLLILTIAFYFVLQFMSIEYVSYFLSKDYIDYYRYAFGNEYIKIANIAIASTVISILSALLSAKTSSHNNKQSEDALNEIVHSVQNTTETSEETVLKNEIEKLKGQIRVKNLEKEYLKLKSKLDE